MRICTYRLDILFALSHTTTPPHTHRSAGMHYAQVALFNPQKPCEMQKLYELHEKLAKSNARLHRPRKKVSNAVCDFFEESIFMALFLSGGATQMGASFGCTLALFSFGICLSFDRTFSSFVFALGFTLILIFCIAFSFFAFSFFSAIFTSGAESSIALATIDECDRVQGAQEIPQFSFLKIPKTMCLILVWVGELAKF